MRFVCLAFLAVGLLGWRCPPSQTVGLTQCEVAGTIEPVKWRMRERCVGNISPLAYLPVAVSFIVNSKGRARKVKVDDGLRKKQQRCLKRILKRLQFPSPRYVDSVRIEAILHMWSK